MIKTKNRFAFLIMVGFLSSFSLLGQDDKGKTAELGLRLGNTRSEGIAIEGVFPVRNNRISANLTFIEEFTVAGLYNWTFDLKNNFLWHVGAGLTVDMGSLFSKVNVDAVVGAGIEHKFAKSPITLGFDWQPVIELSDAGRFSGDAFAFTFRYRLQ